MFGAFRVERPRHCRLVLCGTVKHEITNAGQTGRRRQAPVRRFASTATALICRRIMHECSFWKVDAFKCARTTLQLGTGAW